MSARQSSPELRFGVALLCLTHRLRIKRMPITGRGWELFIQRTNVQDRRGRKRTIGSYQVYHDGVAVAQLSGTSFGGWGGCRPPLTASRYSAINLRVTDRHVPLAHYLSEFRITDPVAAILTHHPKNNIALETTHLKSLKKSLPENCRRSFSHQLSLCRAVY